MLTPEQIIEAAAVLRGAWGDTIKSKGGHCEVCDRWGKINTIALRGIMVKTMHWIHRTGNGDWVDVPALAPRFVARSYSFTSLKHWNMVEQRYVPPPTKEEIEEGITRETRTSGMWRLTPMGIDFIYNGTTAPHKVFVYNDHRVGASDEVVTARDCANEKFNYDEMMNQTFNGDYDALDNY
jgi:hypothetical protein